MKKSLVVFSALFLAIGAQAQSAVQVPDSTRDTVDSLQDFAEKNAEGAAAFNSPAAKAAGNEAYDRQSAASAVVQAPAPVVQPAPAKPSAPSGVTPPADDGSGNGGGDSSPENQIADMISKALQTPQVTQAIDKVREDQMNKVFNDGRVKGLSKELKIGAGVIVAGVALGIAGAIAGAPILAAAGFGLAAGVALVGALSWLFK